MDSLNSTEIALLKGVAYDKVAKIAREEIACRTARFMHGLSRSRVEAIYWSIVIFIILLAMVAAVVYTQTEIEYRSFKQTEERFKAISRPSPDAQHIINEARAKHRSRAWVCVGVCSGLFVMAVIANVMQVMAIFALQHCHKEDLLGLYWPLWTLLGLGSSIAMLGVVITQLYGLHGHDLPPFNVALGTPLLIVSGLGHFLFTWGQKKWEKYRQKNKDADVEADFNSDFRIMVSRGDGLIIQFLQPLSEIPLTATKIGQTSDGMVVVEYSAVSSKEDLSLSGTLTQGEAESQNEPQAEAESQIDVELQAVAVPSEKP
ncbi:hypothetical protein N431DRAFT_188059 [Stipitochalara longipes BDJ]|nr:hypothetical protein N431DRAFT_188059 [Stipitochalara longipes BDJ]